MTAMPLTFAVPKGRILDEALPIMARAGVVPEDGFHDKGNRSLTFATSRGDMRLIRVRAFDVATFVAHGAAQLGIVGSDVIEEFDYAELYAPSICISAIAIWPWRNPEGAQSPSIRPAICGWPPNTPTSPAAILNGAAFRPNA